MWNLAQSSEPEGPKSGAKENKKQKEQRGLYLQVGGQRAQGGGHLGQPQLGAIHRQHDAVLLAVTLRRARGRSARLRRSDVGTARQQNAPEDEALHPQLAASSGEPTGIHPHLRAAPTGRPGALRHRAPDLRQWGERWGCSRGREGIVG